MNIIDINKSFGYYEFAESCSWNSDCYIFLTENRNLYRVNFDRKYIQLQGFGIILWQGRYQAVEYEPVSSGSPLIWVRICRNNENKKTLWFQAGESNIVAGLELCSNHLSNRVLGILKKSQHL